MAISNNKLRSFTGALLLLLIFSVDLFSQTHPSKKLQGVITDEASGELLPLVHVYISNTTSGTTTDENGAFEFITTLSGRQTLVFSYVGYQTKALEMNLDQRSESLVFEVELKPDVLEMDQLEITASNAEWEQMFNRFRPKFLGTSSYAMETEILNPWVIDFELDDTGNLRASASQPVILKNLAFGYQIQLDLLQYRSNRRSDMVEYTFHAMFKELESDNRLVMRRWQRNRERAYNGSFSHFLHSIYHDELKKNQFETFRMNDKNSVKIEEISDWEIRRMNLFHAGYRPATFDKIKGFRLTAPVDVYYGKKTFFSDDRIMSRIVPRTDSGVFLVLNDGSLLDPASLRLDGAWSVQRVGDFLPADYLP